MTTHIPETVVTVACAGCDGPLRLTWTNSAEGWPIFHGPCFERKNR